MCGAYGHERIHAEESRGIFEMSWRPTLERIEGEADAATSSNGVAASEPMTTGYSCRSQTKRFAGRDLRHPIEVLARHVVGATS
jgi:hypothetical protein